MGLGLKRPPRRGVGNGESSLSGGLGGIPVAVAEVMAAAPAGAVDVSAAAVAAAVTAASAGAVVFTVDIGAAAATCFEVGVRGSILFCFGFSQLLQITIELGYLNFRIFGHGKKKRKVIACLLQNLGILPIFRAERLGKLFGLECLVE